MNDIKGIIEDVEKSDLVSDKVIKRIIEIIGQEKWQDINDEKSDICTTTGELIITLKRIPDLEKENAKLKEQHKVDLRQIQAILNQRSIQNKKLTKAKEIIREIMKYEIPTLDYEIAEQFLKEIEK